VTVADDGSSGHGQHYSFMLAGKYLCCKYYKVVLDKRLFLLPQSAVTLTYLLT